MSYSIPREYLLPVTVATYDVGPEASLRLSAILRYQQEAADRHFAPAGLGWQDLAAAGMVFVATAWRCRIERLPRLGENLSLCTWHRERRGPRFFRCYRWTDAAGQECLSGVMQLALVDAAQHRLLRGTEFDRFGVHADETRTVRCPNPERWTPPALQPVGSYPVGRADVDLSRHMNNTRYADLLLDALPAAVQEGAIREVQLRFAGESRPGDTLQLAAAMTPPTVFVRGSTDRGTSFDACVTLCAED